MWIVVNSIDSATDPANKLLIMDNHYQKILIYLLDNADSSNG